MGQPGKLKQTRCTQGLPGYCQSNLPMCSTVMHRAIHGFQAATTVSDSVHLQIASNLTPVRVNKSAGLAHVHSQHVASALQSLLVTYQLL